MSLRLIKEILFSKGMSNNYLNTTNDQLSTLGAYLKTKTFGWALVRIERLVGPGCLFRKKHVKINKMCQVCKFFTKVTKFPTKLFTKVLLFLLFKLAPSSNWALKRTWALIRNFTPKTGRLFGLGT